MAVGSSTSSPIISPSLFAKPTSGSAVSFLNSSDVSPVQRMLADQKKAQETAPGNYMESEDFLRMKAFEIRARIVMFQNLGLTQEYQMAQQEGAEVVKKYQALLQKKAAEESAKAIEDQLNSGLNIKA